MKVRTPGKLILSGEHSVVYGKPALSIAVNRFIESTIETQAPDFLFECDALDYHAHTTRANLLQMKQLATSHYREFQQHRRPIEQVLEQATDLIQIATIDTLEHLGQTDALKIKLSSSIPLGHGLGSSAAVIVNILFGIAHYFNQPFEKKSLSERAVFLENLQHGTSSGLDIATCLEGGCIYFENKTPHHRPVPDLPLFIINTGKPKSSTGACVNHVSAYKNDTALWAVFESVTTRLDQAIKDHDTFQIKQCIHDNHALLCHIGVVPQRVQEFIAALEAAGIAAKISGAGAIMDDRGGTVLAFTNDAEALQRISEEYGYPFERIICTNQGTHIV